MSLEDLNREVYNNDPNLAQRNYKQDEFNPVANENHTNSPFEQNQQWHQVQKGLSPKGKKVLWISVGTFFLIALATAGTYAYQAWLKNAFHQDRVSISFEGPKSADSTQPVKYLIHYKNNNRVTLRDAEIQLSYLENFQPTNNLNFKILSPTAGKIYVGDIKPNSENTVELNGIFYAPKDFPVYLHGKLNFVPSNGKNQLTMENQIGVNITASPVFLDMTAPEQAVDGDSVTYVIDYKNLDVRMMDSMQVRVNFPQGFQLVTASPEPSENDAFWYVGNLDPGQGGKITIQGQISGGSGESKDVAVSLGKVADDGGFVAYSKKNSSIHMVQPVLTVKQSLQSKNDGTIIPGETLKYIVTYQNMGKTGLRDAIITAKIDSRVLDYSKLVADKGSFDSKTNTITWKASDIPALANIDPQASGQVTFQIPVLAMIPVTNNSDKNFTVSSVAKIDSPDIPTPLDANKIIGSNKLVLKLATKAFFDAKGYYADKDIKNSGPVPLETGKETTFSMHWIVSSVSNDLSGVKVVGSLPAGVRWTGQVYPADENVSYNQRTNQITWDLGSVAAGTGIITSARELVFQVGITPQTNQIGDSVPLSNKATLTAKDQFTGKDISLDVAAKDTRLTEDPAMSGANPRVAK